MPAMKRSQSPPPCAMFSSACSQRPVVSGEAISGVNMFKDFGANLSNMFGGRASQYEEEIGGASATAVNEMCARAQAMGANAVVGVKVDYFTAGTNNGMLAAIATGTAVIL